MRVSVGSDHRGVESKNALVEFLAGLGYQVTDEGSHGEASVDYPDIAKIVGRKVSTGEADRGVLICGTGIGMAIAANKFPNVRAANCHDETTVTLSRQHNNLNILCLPGSGLGNEEMQQLSELWMKTEFEGGRHARRVEKIGDLERDNLDTC